MPGFEQFVKCDTRNNAILDKCYGNIKGGYSAKPKPPLSNSDHNTIHLIPAYNSVFKSSKPEHKTVNVWSDDAIETLKGCFMCTDCSLFHALELDEATVTITDYIEFCVGIVVPKKEIVVYPNNKPYVT